MPTPPFWNEPASDPRLPAWDGTAARLSAIGGAMAVLSMRGEVIDATPAGRTLLGRLGIAADKLPVPLPYALWAAVSAAPFGEAIEWRPAPGGACLGATRYMLGSRFSLLLMREVRRVGSNKNIPLGARVISATNRLLFRRDEGSLRPDLYYRLAGFTIHLPPLRDRIDDIATLAQSFARAFAERHHLHNLLLTRDALATLCAHPWPGNVRELRSVVEQSAILASGGEIGPSQISTVLGHSTRTSTAPPPAPPPPPAAAQLPPRDVASGGLRDVERSLIVQAFQTAHGNVTTAAKALGIPRTTLRAKLRRWGLM